MLQSEDSIVNGHREYCLCTNNSNNIELLLSNMTIPHIIHMYSSYCSSPVYMFCTIRPGITQLVS